MIPNGPAMEPAMWKESEIRRPGRPVIRWLPLAHLASPDYCEGLTSDGTWVAETADGLVDLTGNGWLVPALPILERAPEEVRRQLAAALEDRGLSGRLSETFPWLELICKALSGTGYWIPFALNWLEQISIPSASHHQIAELLDAVAGDKRRATQQVRHRARRLSAQYRRPDTGAQRVPPAEIDRSAPSPP
jgi:hypothetical protein